MKESAPIVVTGAAGFLGAAILEAAAEDGVPVRAILRKGAWLSGGGRVGVEVIDCGLDEGPTLLEAFRGCRAVVHAAASMAGQGKDPTATVVDAVRDAATPLVLVSSLSVYASQGIAEGSRVDERRPRFDSAGETGRDAYAMLKLGQERLAEALAGTGHPVIAVRPGVIVGPGRGWSARLGVRKGPVALRIGGAAPLPLIEVSACARAIVRAALLAPEAGFRAFDLVGDHTPTQREHLRNIRRDEGLRVALPLPGGPIRQLGRLLHPMMGSRLPSLLRPAAFDARFKPLRYSNDKAKAAGLL